MSKEEFLEFTDYNKLVFVELNDDWEMRLWFEFGDFVDVHSYEDGFGYIYQGEYYERKDSGNLVSDLIELDTKYINGLVEKYGNQTYDFIKGFLFSFRDIMAMTHHIQKSTYGIDLQELKQLAKSKMDKK